MSMLVGTGSEAVYCSDDRVSLSYSAGLSQSLFERLVCLGVKPIRWEYRKVQLPWELGGV